MEISRLVCTLERDPLRKVAAVEDCEKQLGLKFPPQCVDFLKVADGGEGFIGPSYLILWRVEELKPLNESYEVKTYVPGLLIFGSDGGGEAYGFDTRTADWTIVKVPFLGMDWSLAKPLGSSFKEFLVRLYQGE